jgi:hypothetical protein
MYHDYGAHEAHMKHAIDTFWRTTEHISSSWPCMLKHTPLAIHENKTTIANSLPKQVSMKWLWAPHF